MLKRTSIAVVLALFAAQPAFAVDAQLSKAVVADAASKVIEPAYAAFGSETGKLDSGLRTFCAAPDAAGLDSSRANFGTAVAAWSAAEMVRFGPVTTDNRLERILYWPDRRSAGLKQVQAALAGEDKTVTDIAAMPQKSVALQGFGALEFLLFGTGSEQLATGDKFRCDFAITIAANLKKLSVDIDNDWRGGFAKTWATPGADNPRFRTADESLVEVLNVLIHGLEMVRDVRLGGFFGGGGVRPKQAIYWRSQQTAASLRSNLAFLRRLFADAGIARLLPEASRWIARSTDFEFANADRALASLDGPIDAILADTDKSLKLAYIGLVTSSLTDLIGTKLTAELGLTAGFSSLDGD